VHGLAEPRDAVVRDHLGRGDVELPGLVCGLISTSRGEVSSQNALAAKRDHAAPSLRRIEHDQQTITVRAPGLSPEAREKARPVRSPE
jgi:hypothetical protein